MTDPVISDQNYWKSDRALNRFCKYVQELNMFIKEIFSFDLSLNGAQLTKQNKKNSKEIDYSFPLHLLCNHFLTVTFLMCSSRVQLWSHLNFFIWMIHWQEMYIQCVTIK